MPGRGATSPRMTAKTIWFMFFAESPPGRWRWDRRQNASTICDSRSRDTKQAVMTDTTINVLLVDDFRDISDVYRRLIDSSPGLRCVGTLDSVNELGHHVESLQPHVLVIDLSMPGQQPLKAIASLAEQF